MAVFRPPARIRRDDTRKGFDAATDCVERGDCLRFASGIHLELSDTCNRAATELLRLTRLTDILNIFTTEVEAVRSYATPGASAINCCYLALISFKRSRLRPVSATGEVVAAIIDRKYMHGWHLRSS